jgi:CheY-like chemotaxis protein
MTDKNMSQSAAPFQREPNLLQRILVVDDNNAVRQFSVAMLVGSGYDVEAVKDGAAGWEALQAGNYDLVITDNKMSRMTGIEMIEKLRSARMTVPVIMATGTLPTQEFARKPWLKPEAMLEKPYSNDDLLGAVKKILNKDDGSDGRKETIPPMYP